MFRVRLRRERDGEGGKRAGKRRSVVMWMGRKWAS